MAEWFKCPTRFLRDARGKRLGRLIGKDAARWVPVHLLAFCTEQEKDDISELDAVGLADQLDYEGDAAALLRALIESGFISDDGKRVLDWWPICGEILERARKQRSEAAKARWSRSSPHPSSEEKEEEKKEEERRVGRTAAASEPDASRMRAAPPSPLLFPWNSWDELPIEFRAEFHSYMPSWLEMKFSDVRDRKIRYRDTFPSVDHWLAALRSELRDLADKSGPDALSHEGAW